MLQNFTLYDSYFIGIEKPISPLVFKENSETPSAKEIVTPAVNSVVPALNSQPCRVVLGDITNAQGGTCLAVPPLLNSQPCPVVLPVGDITNPQRRIF
jgi:hypothetical protein